MSPVRISGALLERLGGPASAELDDVLHEYRQESTEAVMSQSAERFERRLVEETSRLSLEISELRGETRAGFADLRREMAGDRFELIKWAFAFWVAQLAGVAGIVAALMRK